MSKLISLVGNQYGYLTAMRYVKGKWECQCKCGTLTYVQAGSLKNGITKSCGCYRKEVAVVNATKHGMTGHPALESYKGAKGRCTCTTDRDYPYYGGRGIKFELPEFTKFWEVMGTTWFQGATLERINNEYNYSMENIKWATRQLSLIGFGNQK
jgi:hypothetical protein